jgi:hypothetical protein
MERRLHSYLQPGCVRFSIYTSCELTCAIIPAMGNYAEKFNGSIHISMYVKEVSGCSRGLGCQPEDESGGQRKGNGDPGRGCVCSK